jgi:hypothetical protein
VTVASRTRITSFYNPGTSVMSRASRYTKPKRKGHQGTRREPENLR